MSRNTNGQYTLPLPPAIPGTLITAEWANTTLNDVSQALTDSLDREGRGGMNAPMRVNGGTALQPGYSFNASTSSGMYLFSASSIKFSFNGVDVFGYSDIGMQVVKPMTVLPPVDPMSPTTKEYVDAGLSAAGYNGLPATAETVGTIPNTNSGKCVYATGYVQIDGSWAKTNVLTIINTTAAAINVIPIGTLMLYLAGTTNNGTRSLAPNGVATVVWLSPTVALISGTSLV